MTTELFTEFGLILVIASAMALLMRLLRQPLIIGHIITGLLVGPFAFDLLRSDDIFILFSEIGVAFLLFSVGLSLDPRVLKDYGLVAVVTGVGQVVFTTLIGLGITLMLGFELIPALYISVALAFSSTIIILKLISDKGDLEKLYSKISIGFLLVQDLIAVLLLFGIPLISAGTGSLRSFGLTLLEAVGLTVAVFLAARFVLVRLHSYFARSPELLFLVATAWGLGIAVLFREIGFSLEVGALIAGIALAMLPSRQEIHARLMPLRDFFIVLFFIVLGAQMVLGNWVDLLLPAVILSLLVLVGNPLILMVIMGLLGYRKKTSLQTGFTVAQISEFSLILVALGLSLGHVDQSVLSMVTLVGLITIFGSTYLILYSDWWYKRLEKYLRIFERARPSEKRQRSAQYDFVLFGGSRIGFDFIDLFSSGEQPFLVVDYDPEVIEQLHRRGIPCEYGDAGDLDLLESIDFEGSELVVSTVPDLNTNLLILDVIKATKSQPPVMAVSHSISNALALYEAGVAYVILPHFLGGKQASSLAKRFAAEAFEIHAVRRRHIQYLKARLTQGHEHPVIERYR